MFKLKTIPHVCVYNPWNHSKIQTQMKRSQIKCPLPPCWLQFILLSLLVCSATLAFSLSKPCSFLHLLVASAWSESVFPFPHHSCLPQISVFQRTLPSLPIYISSWSQYHFISEFMALIPIKNYGLYHQIAWVQILALWLTSYRTLGMLLWLSVP